MSINGHFLNNKHLSCEKIGNMIAVHTWQISSIATVACLKGLGLVVADESRLVVKQIMDINDLCKACLEGDTEVEDIIAKGEVDVNKNNTNGHAPLICAVMKGHPMVVKVLLDCREPRLDLVDESNNGWTALHWACWGPEQEQTECLKIIINDCRCDSALVNMKNKKGNTAISHAVFMGNFEAVKILANFDGIELDAKDDNGETLIDAAASQCDKNYVDESKKERHHKILNFLKEKLNDIRLCYERRCKYHMMLCNACEAGHDDLVQEILNKGQVDINAPDSCGTPPLFFAVQNKNPTTLQILLANEKTSLDFTNFANWTVFHWACCGSGEDITKCLQLLVDDNRCNPDLINKKTNEGKTALAYAVVMGNFDAVKILLNYPGIEFDPEDKTENSPLSLAEEECNGYNVGEPQYKEAKDILEFLKGVKNIWRKLKL